MEVPRRAFYRNVQNVNAPPVLWQTGAVNECLLVLDEPDELTFRQARSLLGPSRTAPYGAKLIDEVLFSPPGVTVPLNVANAVVETNRRGFPSKPSRPQSQTCKDGARRTPS